LNFKIKIMFINISLSTEQKSKLLEMFDYYYSDLIFTDAKDVTPLPFIDENGLIEYNTTKPKIHWYEFLSNILFKRIVNNNFYWVNRYVQICIQYYDPKNYHPIDFAYEKFKLTINNEPLFKMENNDHLIEKEEKKERSKKNSKSKLPNIDSAQVIDSQPNIIKENSSKIKKSVSAEDFFE